MTRPVHLLILSRYDERGASSRLRTLQYIPFLEEHGFVVTHQPLFNSAYLGSIYRSSNWLATRARNGGRVVMAMARRLSAVMKARQYDVIWVEKELFPYLPGWFEGFLARANIPYVVDYDDAIFHRYDATSRPGIRRLLGQKLDPLLRGAFAVTAGNRYLADYATQHGARRMELLPTVIDIDRYYYSAEPVENEFRICWIGSPSTAPYLNLISEPLRVLATERPIRLVTIGAPSIKMPGVPLEQHDWTLESEAALIGGCHIGVMPLTDTLWERGKCGYKLIQYMACGRPVVASPIGVNIDLVGDNVGFLAANDDAWLDAFRTLANALDYRTEMGSAARQVVEDKYTQQIIAPKIFSLLKEAAKVR